MNESWFVRGLLQLHFLLGIIANPRLVLVDIFGEESIDLMIEQVKIDKAIYNILTEDFEGIENYFKKKGWYCPSSPLEFHVQLMQEIISCQITRPYSHIFTKPFTKRSKQKLNTRIRQFLLLKFSQKEHELYAVELADKDILIFKLFCAAADCSRQNKALKSLIQILIDRIANKSEPETQTLWRESRSWLYFPDRSIKPKTVEQLAEL